MSKIYTDANPKVIAYYIEDSGGCGTQNTPPNTTIMQAEYLAIVYGLNEYFRLFNSELDARQDDLDTERLRVTGEHQFFNVATPSQRTIRSKPPPILVLCDNEVVVHQLDRSYHIADEKLRHLAMRVWQMTKGLEVKYQWISRKENIAGKMLK